MSTHINKQTFTFHILCKTSIAGGVIGHSGTIIKHLERETSTRIQVDPPISPSSKERLIHVTGSNSCTKRVVVGCQEVVVSSVQDGLVRVFDRMLEIEPLLGVCRLVVGNGNGDVLCGGAVGVGGVRFVGPFSGSGSGLDQVLEISGDIISIKKALVIVSQNIQQKSTLGITGDDKGANRVQSPSMKMEPSVSKVDHRVNEAVVGEVVFKLLCSYDEVGCVIGYKGRKVKALEEETKATIRFSSPDNDYNERVATIWAFENRNAQHSCAQNALVRVFNESMSRQKENVTARLLIPLRQSGCLAIPWNSIVASISKGTGATLELLDQKYTHVGVSSDEKVLQIEGKYPNVQTALFQVSWMQRESVFNVILSESNVPFLPHKAFNLPPPLKEVTTLTKNMKSCTVNEEVNNASSPSIVQLSEFPSKACLSTSMERPRDLTKVKGGLARGSGKKSVTVTNTKVEIAVRADVFTSVFSDDGSKLSRIRTISGANVEVKHPSSGGDGQVIISGTPEQTLAAQSLLQAFILTAL